MLHAWSFPAIVYSRYGPTPDIGEPDMETAGIEILDRALAAADTDGVRVTRRLVHERIGTRVARSGRSADLLAVGTRGHGGFAGLVLGSTSQHCAHHPPCPVVP